jgi:hypothetical protein
VLANVAAGIFILPFFLSRQPPDSSPTNTTKPASPGWSRYSKSASCS